MRAAASIAYVGALLIGSALSAAAQPAEECDYNDSVYPRVVIGAWQLLERDPSPDNAVQTLSAYVARGFNAFDTADIYGPSEGILGQLHHKLDAEASPTARSSTLRFFTKYVTDSATLANARRVNAQSRTALAAVPDMVQFHWWDYADESFSAAAAHLVALRSEGLVGDVAACNFDTPHLMTLVDAGVPMVANQVQYSLLDRRPENGMVQYAKEKGIRLACFGTVAGGLLSDRFLGAPGLPQSGSGTTVSMRMYSSALKRWGDWGLFQELLRELRRVADRHGTTIANVASAWVLYKLGEDGGWVIIGVRDTRHLEEHVALREVTLDEADVVAIDAVADKGQPPHGDIWSHERGR